MNMLYMLDYFSYISKLNNIYYIIISTVTIINTTYSNEHLFRKYNNWYLNQIKIILRIFFSINYNYITYSYNNCVFNDILTTYDLTIKIVKFMQLLNIKYCQMIKWTTLQNAIQTALMQCVAFNKRNKFVYDVGDYNEQQKDISQNMKMYFDDIKQQVTICKIKVIKNAFKYITKFYEIFYTKLGYTFVFLNDKVTLNDIENLLQILN
ncbi:hypothetical protein RFI_01424 [Reticulomyxa filosa]|uniref:Uncharacterized protein n=1 Tax=Reticulomyxa filosa TaxID=46433 RepID=X6PBZ3_RETFI|nr:hypothetical protein RFI_01424 [Reticulomyxa filosa]|eukprot:ETO35638.1 hypothetical protein RFI_01424 [Reticulomyxa filosa]